LAKTRIKAKIPYHTNRCGQGCGSSVLVLERVFVVGGEVVAATTRVLAGRGRDLDQISVAVKQETGPAEMRCQPEGAVVFRVFCMPPRRGRVF
jgi:hypothetical protein